MPSLQILAAVSVALLAVLLVGPPTSTAHQTGEVELSRRQIDEQGFVQRLNAERAARGLAPLAVAPDIHDAARQHSKAMADATTLFHNPDLQVQVCCWVRVAETVGAGPSVTAVHDRLMSSPAHRAILLDARVDQVGIGVAHAGDRVYVAHVFRKRR